MRRCEISGFFQCQSWYGISPSIDLVGHLFQTWMKAERHSPQKILGRPDWLSMVVIRSVIVLFARSATPFCCGRFRTVCCCSIPHCAVNALNSFEKYSPPLSSRRSFICLSSRFSAWALKFLKACSTSDLFLIGVTTRYLEWSSMKVTQ